MKHLQILTSTAILMAILVGCARNDSYESGGGSPSSQTESAPQAADIEYDRKLLATTEESGDLGLAMGNRMATDSISSIMSSSAAKGSPLADTSYQFIRTADVRMRVQNVRTSTFAIEKIVARFDGYVAHTSLESNIDNETRTKVSDDSTLITTYFTVSNNFTLRVPTAQLDSTLRTIGFLAEYLDYRRIHAENATLSILRERLAARRINHSTARLEDAADDANAKLRDRAAVEEALFNKQTAADESLIRTLELKDQIKLSTITLQIYQRQDFTHEMVANEKNIDAYKPGFWSDAGQAIQRGWQGFLRLIVGILHLWPLVVVVSVILLGGMIWRRRRSGK